MKVGNLEVYGIIYKITNKSNGKVYIGQTIRGFNERYYKGDIEKYTHNNYLKNSIKKYGIDNFKIEIIDNANDCESLNNKEIYWIKYYNCIIPNGYNQCEGGGNTKGYKHREDAKRKMSITKSNMYFGRENPFYGKHHSKEQCKKWREERKGRKLSKEWIEKIIKSQQKKVINLDTKEVFNSVKEAANKYNLKDTHISRVCKGKRKRTGGYRWMHYQEYINQNKLVQAS